MVDLRMCCPHIPMLASAMRWNRATAASRLPCATGLHTQPARNTRRGVRMKRCLAFAMAVVAAGLATQASAAGIGLNGPHYNLNVIGVENPKTTNMSGTDRHTIFVGLGGKNSTVTSRIYLTPGP